MPVQSWPGAIVQALPVKEEASTFAAFLLGLALFIAYDPHSDLPAGSFWRVGVQALALPEKMIVATNFRTKLEADFVRFRSIWAVLNIAHT